MKAWLALQARRIDRLSLRERAIMFVSLAVAFIAAADALVFTPRVDEHKRLTQQLRQHSSANDTLRLQLSGNGAADTPAAQLSRQLQQLQQRRAEVDARIQQRSADGATALRLPQLLERVLRRHERLTLLRLATVAPAATSNSNTRGSANGGTPGAARPLQTVEIALAGSYPDLARYVAEAEQAMPGLRWGELQISSARGTPELVAQVVLIGDAP